MVATFGAIVAGAVIASGQPAPEAGAVAHDAAVAAYQRVFFSIAMIMSVALISIFLIEEKPLQSGVAPEQKER